MNKPFDKMIGASAFQTFKMRGKGEKNGIDLELKF